MKTPSSSAATADAASPPQKHAATVIERVLAIVAGSLLLAICLPAFLPVSRAIPSLRHADPSFRDSLSAANRSAIMTAEIRSVVVDGQCFYRLQPSIAQ